MKHRILAILTPLLLVAALGASTAVRAELPVVNGEHWTDSDRDSKLSYLLGMMTMAAVELSLIGDPPPPGTVSFVPALDKGLEGMTLTQLMDRLDALYADNADLMDDAVLTVIWKEIVIPRLEESEGEAKQ